MGNSEQIHNEVMPKHSRKMYLDKDVYAFQDYCDSKCHFLVKLRRIDTFVVSRV